MINLILGLLLLALHRPNLHAQVCATVNFISFECVKSEKTVSKEKAYLKFKVTNYQGKSKIRKIPLEYFNLKEGTKEDMNFEFDLCNDMTIELDLVVKAKPELFKDDFLINCSKISSDNQEAHFRSALGGHYIFKYKIIK